MHRDYVIYKNAIRADIINCNKLDEKNCKSNFIKIFDSHEIKLY